MSRSYILGLSLSKNFIFFLFLLHHTLSLFLLLNPHQNREFGRQKVFLTKIQNPNEVKRKKKIPTRCLCSFLFFFSFLYCSKKKKKPSDSYRANKEKENYKLPRKEKEKMKRADWSLYFSHNKFFFSFLPNKRWGHSPAPPSQYGTHPPHYLFLNHIIHFSHFLLDLSVSHSLLHLLLHYASLFSTHTFSFSLSLSLSPLNWTRLRPARLQRRLGLRRKSIYKHTQKTFIGFFHY